jgi:hypothetical protein
VVEGRRDRFSDKSIGVSPRVSWTFLDFWAGFRSLFLGVFLEAFSLFFRAFKNCISGIFNPNEINTSKSRTVNHPSRT